MSAARFSSLGQFLASIGGSTHAEAIRAALDEHSIVAAQIEAIRNVGKKNPKRTHPVLHEYRSGLAMLRCALETPHEFEPLPDDYTKRQIQSALEKLVPK